MRQFLRQLQHFSLVALLANIMQHAANFEWLQSEHGGAGKSVLLVVVVVVNCCTQRTHNHDHNMILDLPQDLLFGICERLSSLERAKISVSCQAFRWMNRERCARHAVFQHTKSIMTPLMYKRFAQQYVVGNSAVVFIITRDVLTYLHFRLDRVQTQDGSVTLKSLSCICALSRPSMRSNCIDVLFVNGTDTNREVLVVYPIPIKAWELYVCECRMNNTPAEKGYRSR